MKSLDDAILFSPCRKAKAVHSLNVDDMAGDPDQGPTQDIHVTGFSGNAADPYRSVDFCFNLSPGAARGLIRELEAAIQRREAAPHA